MAVIVRILVEPASEYDHDRLDAVIETHVRGGPPSGMLAHLAAPTDAGFEIIDAWRSEAAFRAFFDDLLAPAFVEADLPAGEPHVAPAWSIAAP